MTPKQLKQALSIRVLRSEKAERELMAARATEAQALASVRAVENQLALFDASFEARVASFMADAAEGTRPETLHSVRSFHTDLAAERVGIQAAIDQAWGIVEIARTNVAHFRTLWAAASTSANNLKDMHEQAEITAQRVQERHAEMDADEIAISRSFRNGR